jgi:transcriptional regulator with XRE-family HTH domain
VLYFCGVKRKPKRRRLDGPIHGRIAELREARHLSQEELATAVGVDKTAVSHWENGVSRPDLSRLCAVASALGVSVDELISGEKAA